jgi:hypothetical protein
MADHERIRTSDGRPLSSIAPFKTKGAREKLKDLKDLPEWEEPVELTIVLIDRLNHPEDDQPTEQSPRGEPSKGNQRCRERRKNRRAR